MILAGVSTRTGRAMGKTTAGMDQMNAAAPRGRVLQTNFAVTLVPVLPRSGDATEMETVRMLPMKQVP